MLTGANCAHHIRSHFPSPESLVLSTHELAVFVEAALTENFSLAAQSLSLSQPAVSLLVRNLERSLGVDLFRRNGRNVTLSDAGRALLPMAQRLLNDARRIEETIGCLQGIIMGKLEITCSTSAGKYILPNMITGFRQECPRVQVAVNVVSRRVALARILEGQADLALASVLQKHRDLQFQPYCSDEIVLIVPPDHKWAHVDRLVPGDLLTEPFILDEPSSGAYEVLSAGLAAHGLFVTDLETAMTLGNAEAIAMSVEAGLGVGFVSRLAAQRGIATGCVIQVPVSQMTLERTIYMVRHANREGSPAQQAFWESVHPRSNSSIPILAMSQLV
jgi:LysR family transcriptional regulator, low CO2-responsive transcriptional regulator